MRIEQLREYIHKHPTTPFTLHVADGRAIPVRHSDYIAVPEKARTIVVVQEDGTFDILDVVMITGIGGVGQPIPSAHQ